MIPDHNLSGVIPPFIPGSNPTNAAAVSPYETSMVEIANRFGNTAKRKVLLEGLLNYREALRKEGIVYGFQWIDGSFVENVEANQGRDPSDIDVVTFASRPAHVADLRLIAMARPELFNPALTKTSFSCDAYFVDLGLTALAVHEYTAYWLSLFSHQRATSLWKGMLKVPLQSDDDVARSLLTA